MKQCYLCEPAGQPDLLQRYPLVKDAVATDNLDDEMLRDAEFQPQQLLHVTYACTDRTANKLGLQWRQLIVVKHVSSQATNHSNHFTMFTTTDSHPCNTGSIPANTFITGGIWKLIQPKLLQWSTHSIIVIIIDMFK